MNNRMNEAQKTLYYIAENMKMDKSISEDGYKHFQQAIEALERFKWIPVSDHYPSIENEYCKFLVCDDKGRMSIQTFYLTLNDEPQPYFSGMVNVIAWMPLPEPYESQEKENE